MEASASKWKQLHVKASVKQVLNQICPMIMEVDGLFPQEHIRPQQPPVSFHYWREVLWVGLNVGGAPRLWLCFWFSFWSPAQKSRRLARDEPMSRSFTQDPPKGRGSVCELLAGRRGGLNANRVRLGGEERTSAVTPGGPFLRSLQQTEVPAGFPLGMCRGYPSNPTVEVGRFGRFRTVVLHNPESSASNFGKWRSFTKLGPPARCPFSPYLLLVGRVSPTKIDYRKQLVPLFQPLYRRT